MNSNVESFSLDHTSVKAPYVRLAKRVEVGSGRDSTFIEKYDIRFCQPNKDFLSPAVMHSLEHMLAYESRNFVDWVFDVSPMGCCTGFYFTVLGRHSPNEILGLLNSVFEVLLKYEEVPGATIEQCGNYKLHDLANAKIAIRGILHRMTVLE